MSELERLEVATRMDMVSRFLDLGRNVLFSEKHINRCRHSSIYGSVCVTV